ncbi:shTK domain protein [Ancylostoma ceylanicum]|uniref:ShTK domain protein n=3 Tax=Ancylostoma ceylanicum TaxID=53326 RepID=A0A0D6LWT4_9BILA|nr:shTK domain protein [Ancylostoma ceylanicum]
MIRWAILLAAVGICLAEDLAKNITCRQKTRSKCFLGKCPSGFTCLPSDDCCKDDQVVLPPEECKDFMEHCEIAQCDHVDFIDFARANCAKTCNFCFENATLPPEYACTDLLEDCRDRMKLCRDMDFMDMMAVFCPRSCMLCTYAPPPGQCQELVSDCATRENFCTTTKTSVYQKTMGCGKTCGKC